MLEERILVPGRGVVPLREFIFNALPEDDWMDFTVLVAICTGLKGFQQVLDVVKGLVKEGLVSMKEDPDNLPSRFLFQRTLPKISPTTDEITKLIRSLGIETWLIDVKEDGTYLIPMETSVSSEEAASFGPKPDERSVMLATLQWLKATHE